MLRGPVHAVLLLAALLAPAVSALRIVPSDGRHGGAPSLSASSKSTLAAAGSFRMYGGGPAKAPRRSSSSTRSGPPSQDLLQQLLNPSFVPYDTTDAANLRLSAFIDDDEVRP